MNQPEFHGMSLVVGFDRCCQEPGEEEDEEPDLSPCVAAVVLAIATVLTSYSTDFLIDSIEGTHFFGRSVGSVWSVGPFRTYDFEKKNPSNKWELYIESSHVFEYPSNMGKTGYGGL